MGDSGKLFMGFEPWPQSETAQSAIHGLFKSPFLPTDGKFAFYSPDTQE